MLLLPEEADEHSLRAELRNLSLRGSLFCEAGEIEAAQEVTNRVETIRATLARLEAAKAAKRKAEELKKKAESVRAAIEKSRSSWQHNEEHLTERFETKQAELSLHHRIQQSLLVGAAPRPPAPPRLSAAALQLRARARAAAKVQRYDLAKELRQEFEVAVRAAELEAAERTRRAAEKAKRALTAKQSEEAAKARRNYEALRASKARQRAEEEEALRRRERLALSALQDEAAVPAPKALVPIGASFSRGPVSTADASFEFFNRAKNVSSRQISLRAILAPKEKASLRSAL